MRRFVPLLLLYGVLGASLADAGALLQVQPACAANDSIAISIQFFNSDQFPTPIPPEWVGYDVYRRRLDVCSGEPAERINATILPRWLTAQEVRYVDLPPSSAGTWEYRAVTVDANRAFVPIIGCDCYGTSYANCPAGVAPVARGTVVDWGWTLFLMACPETCLPSAYFDGEPETIAALRALAGTNTVVQLYGGLGCCSVEGPAIRVDRFEAAACGPTPTTRSSWGRLKSSYR